MRGFGGGDSEFLNPHQLNLNLSLELQKVVNEHLMMENYDMDEEAPQIENPFDMPDFLGNDEENLFFDKELIAEAGKDVPIKKNNKKQVQQIRQEMMKFDKKIQRQQA
jgi:hypothetical protein